MDDHEKPIRTAAFGELSHELDVLPHGGRVLADTLDILRRTVDSPENAARIIQGGA